MRKGEHGIAIYAPMLFANRFLEQLKAFLVAHNLELEHKQLAPGPLGYTAGTLPDLTTRETEAEAVTSLLCAQFGLAGTEASIEYIPSHRGTPDTLDASLERIRATAQRLATELAAIAFAEVTS